MTADGDLGANKGLELEILRVESLLALKKTAVPTMAQIPTPPASRCASEPADGSQEGGRKPVVAEVTSGELLESLDQALERYLELLDRHQKLQVELGKCLSSGFLSLAHANYSSPPGRRYGVDYYDDRMKATRKISLEPTVVTSDTETFIEENRQPDTPRHAFTITHAPREDNPATEDKETGRGDGGEKPMEPPTPTEQPGVNSHEGEQRSVSTSGSETEAAASVKPKPARKVFRSWDPITWYGILVPPSLRHAQKSFTEAVEGPVSGLAGTVVEMKEAEEKILELRKAIEQRNH
ncbi:hypothetical protein ASPZODRAFT_136301 [Penicilliopsis zonata CBS 506.65]|uniref:Vacuolar ATPase assembly protein VMA22 n=1 Tax=Penicilliopsis zonata CBS 506.65 TaxID=1073090 RepID=A0A1L9S8G3_9EURO|nr:hypothetical protein ASPZODRAFT_136301 [Penicilliopsis zonata CBS 506.65]OJJ43439.1 hypothetical protein ASPZODRAFT_136301 [Penicilliopsis zonata CBS 506.65]